MSADALSAMPQTRPKVAALTARQETDEGRGRRACPKCSRFAGESGCPCRREGRRQKEKASAGDDAGLRNYAAGRGLQRRSSAAERRALPVRRRLQILAPYTTDPALIKRTDCGVLALDCAVAVGGLGSAGSANPGIFGAGLRSVGPTVAAGRRAHREVGVRQGLRLRRVDIPD